jgi:peroxiredoxin
MDRIGAADRLAPIVLFWMNVLMTGVAPQQQTRPRRPLEAGDIAPRFSWPDGDGGSIDPHGDRLAGKPLLIAFCPDLGSDESSRLLTAMQQAHDRMTALGAGLYAVTPASASVNQAVAASLGLRFALLSDPAGESFQAYGLAAADADPAPAVFLLGRNQHLLLAARGMADNPVARSLERLEALAVLDRSQVMAPHPPVLILPDVFSPADCQHLMSIFALQGNVWIEPSHGDQDMADDYKMRVHDYGRMDRIDHFVMTPKNRQFIGARLQARLFPEIRKAFQYRITRYEPYRIACYEGERGGEMHGHRDDSLPVVAHRRFAVSVNLNTEDFEGGALRFPEFGDQRYRPATGAALVFSCSLLHEALPVTQGRRFVVLGFLSGEH